jgi:hypothetical protein
MCLPPPTLWRKQVGVVVDVGVEGVHGFFGCRLDPEMKLLFVIACMCSEPWHP